MKQGWESKKLGEVAKIGAGNSAPQDKSLFTNGMYPFFRTSDIGKIRIGGVSTAVDLLNDQGIKKLKLYPKGTILLPKSGASTFLNHRVILDVDGFVSSHLATVVCNEDLLDKRFALYYLIGIKAQDLIQDHSYPSLKLSDIKEIPIPIPPLEEQKQIVAKLDQCFEAIDKAKANAAKNLENAKELFQSKLNEIFSQKGEGWVEKKLGDVCSLEYGKPLPKEDRDPDGLYPAYGANGIKTRTDKFLVNGRSIIVGRKGSAGEINYTEDKFWALDVTYYTKFDSNILDLDFLYYLLSLLKLPKLAKGVKPGINRNDVYAITIQLPPLKEQSKIAIEMKHLENITNSLESKYQQELNSLEELKKSILQKAFEGELV